MQGRIKCTKCNNMIAIGTVFCPYCGTEQAPSGTVNENVKNRRRRGNHNVPIIKTGEDVMVPVKVKEVAAPKEDKSIFNKEMDKPVVKHEDIQETTSNNSSEIQEKNEDKMAPEMTKAENPVTEQADRENPVSSNPEVSTEPEMSEQGAQKQDVPSEFDEEEASEIFGEILRENSEEEPKDDEISVDKSAESRKENVKTSKLKQKKTQKSMEYELYHDSLTGCLNRKAYEKRLDELDSDNYCIIVADANNLKRTNDSLGHANGDILLVAIAQSLQAVFGNENCYRMGGDEFAVILEGIEEDVVKERIERFHIDLKGRERKQRENGAQIDMKAAIGYAYGKKKSEIKTVCKEADKNMYIDKRQSKQIYNPNYDSYYNDVKVQYEEMKVDFNRENLHKALLVIFAVIIFMIFYFVFIL